MPQASSGSQDIGPLGPGTPSQKQQPARPGAFSLPAEVRFSQLCLQSVQPPPGTHIPPEQEGAPR
eukprot:3150609-Pyramimonas_sp.AAC.1